MKCPKCGNELKRSQKNPEFGLCYNCKLKFKWKEEVPAFDEEDFEYAYTESPKEPERKSTKTKKEKTKICKHCKTEIPHSAKFCPNCRKKQKKGILSKITIAFLALVVIGILFGSDDETNTTPEENVKVEETEQVQEVEAKETKEPEDDVPTEYKSALAQAYDYSEVMHMSKKGIYNQLTSEYGGQFTEEAAQYAIDNIDVDWNANALSSAKNYSDTMHMSKKGIYNQLISEYGEQFTEEEAQYAVDNLEADYKANALETAKNYQSSMNMSPAAIYDQLISEYGEQFTKEEAQYAIDNL